MPQGRTVLLGPAEHRSGASYYQWLVRNKFSELYHSHWLHVGEA